MASIRRIDNISPIENADMIEKLTIGGWNVVSQKGLHKVGDLIVYIEIDSFLPEGTEAWQDLVEKSSRIFNDCKGHVLKSIKLRGVISQGFVIPLSCIPSNGDWKEGDDVSEILGIVKYELPIPANLSGLVKGNFPFYIPKTDEIRIQNFTEEEFESLKKEVYVVTEKLEGTSCTMFFKDGDFGVCSRNLELKETDSNTYWKVAKQLDIENKVRNAQNSENSLDQGDYFLSKHKNFALQMEIIGEGIQDNIYKLKGQEAYVYNGYDIDTQEYLSTSTLKYICTFLGLKEVPIVDVFKSIENVSMEELINYADGKSQINPNVNREGVVFKTFKRVKSFKVISNLYLLKQK